LKKIILIALALLVIQKWDSIQGVFSPPPDYSALQTADVVLYATDWCGYCAKARKLFSENNIPYIEYDIEKSDEGREQYESLGGGGVPLILIDGQVINGYNAGKILSMAR